MKKKEIEVNIDYDLDWRGEEPSISQMRKDLDAIEALGATHVSIEAYVDYDCSTLEILPIQKRIETDKEYSIRIERISQNKKNKELMELKELERLQLKYKTN